MIVWWTFGCAHHATVLLWKSDDYPGFSIFTSLTSLSSWFRILKVVVLYCEFSFPYIWGCQACVKVGGLCFENSVTGRSKYSELFAFWHSSSNQALKSFSQLSSMAISFYTKWRWRRWSACASNPITMSTGILHLLLGSWIF